ncbi:GIY-YIG nuclease family protein [Oscillochloris sp. ZM17-4]|uniref:GIY-YIG nuclease family protein n=1 Tax=Oscillochloris sp. ZM17-4 TaxID=2866714 RepID=UPI001C73AF0F|nr:GIY-YIG nuclease family protein [Oscillochloris sp. ZM17-4]MBX0329203.1 GIY-YIG nuclease family protein [Oscillochloris sp. ZM17-4]
MHKGSYILVLQLDHAIDDLQVGKLGRYTFPAGSYLYVGSALGAGGLEARLRHHERREKARPHWHIDYLRAHALLCEVWTVASPVRLESRWCAMLSRSPDVSIPVAGFGSSDTRCPAHLFHMARPPRSSFLSQIILADLLADGPAEIQIEVHHFDTPA